MSVSAGLAVLAGIAASDALCCLLLHERSRGPDHRSAAQLLEKATRDGKRLAACLSRLIDLKDEAHYGVILVSTRKARDAVQRARTLVDRASEELSR